MAVLLITGCISLPHPRPGGPLADSRTNVPAEIPTWIVTGQTTRRDVLLHLGEPDAAGPDDQWFTYGSASTSGGTGVLTISLGASYESRDTVHFRRLVLQFEDNGVVRAVRLDTKRCPMWDSTLLSYASKPCLDVRRPDLGTEETRAASSTPEPASHSPEPTAAADSSGNAEPPIPLFRTVVRREGDCPERGHPRYTGHEEPADLQVLAHELVFTRQVQQHEYSTYRVDEGEPVRLPIGQIESVAVFKGTMFWVWINVHMKDGTCSSVQFNGRKIAERAAQSIQQRMAST